MTIGGREVRIAPLFILYDYSFRPLHIPIERAVDWAREEGIECADEVLLHPDPYADLAEWCHARCEITEQRLKTYRNDLPTVLINHFPLREDLAKLPRIPRFSIWCGTRRTEDWHLRFNAAVVVSGHLHIRSTSHRDGVRFEEVSLGYPRQWSGLITPDHCVREILSETTLARSQPRTREPAQAPFQREFPVHAKAGVRSPPVRMHRCDRYSRYNNTLNEGEGGNYPRFVSANWLPRPS